ncbi:MAG: metallophosphoesterase [Planctomycetota bacterium]|jgi:bis(5'-nucleosyl)-tetraphosphatase (symmetrical)
MPPPIESGPGATRRWYVGDIQGCREELELLLESIGFDPSTDDLRPVGDLVNRGPDSLGTLRLLQTLGARPVLGNHDLHLLGVADGTRDRRPGDTLDAVLEAEDRDELLTWLRSQPLLRVDPDSYQVHAGIHPGWADPTSELDIHGERTPSTQAVRFATTVRECDASGRQPREESHDAATNRPWFDHYDSDRHTGRGVVFGHWAVRGLVRERNVVGLDSGCVWGGSLTAWCPEEDRQVSIAARAQHQRPGRRG